MNPFNLDPDPDLYENEENLPEGDPSPWRDLLVLAGFFFLIMGILHFGVPASTGETHSVPDVSGAKHFGTKKELAP